MKTLTISLIIALSIISEKNTFTQEPESLVYMDLSHGQRFWNDPMDLLPNIGIGDTARIEYLNQELLNSLEPFDARISFLKEGIFFRDIKNGDLLILHVPSTRYTTDEIGDIKRYLDKGGNALLVMEADYWTDITKTNLNDILEPYEIAYGLQSVDSLAGGYTKAGALTQGQLKVTYQFGRSIEGGTPFAFSSQNDEPFGVFKQLESGGKLVVLGDAMSTLYMTEWRGVNDYQCQEFMQGVFEYLLGR
ncbi:MAG: hypothetical protein AAF363_16330 [Bacteroidota bacterium]